MLGIGLTELLTWPWRSDIAQRDIDALRLQLAREVLAHNAEVRAAWVRAVAAQQLVSYHRQVQDAAAASAELARRMQAVGNFSRLQRAREQAFLADATTQLARAHGRRPRSSARRWCASSAWTPTMPSGCNCPSACPTCRPRPAHGDEVAQRAMDERLDLLLARAQLGAAQRAMGLETVQLFDIELAAVRELGPGGERGRGFEAGIRLPLLDPGIALRQASSAKLLAAQQPLRAGAHRGRLGAARALRAVPQRASTWRATSATRSCR